jgi:hypothetical protein
VSRQISASCAVQNSTLVTAFSPAVPIPISSATSAGFLPAIERLFA